MSGTGFNQDSFFLSCAAQTHIPATLTFQENCLEGRLCTRTSPVGSYSQKGGEELKTEEYLHRAGFPPQEATFIWFSYDFQLSNWVYIHHECFLMDLVSIFKIFNLKFSLAELIVYLYWQISWLLVRRLRSKEIVISSLSYLTSTSSRHCIYKQWVYQNYLIIPDKFNWI